MFFVLFFLILQILTNLQRFDLNFPLQFRDFSLRIDLENNVIMEKINQEINRTYLYGNFGQVIYNDQILQIFQIQFLYQSEILIVQNQYAFELRILAKNEMLNIQVITLFDLVNGIEYKENQNLKSFENMFKQNQDNYLNINNLDDSLQQMLQKNNKYMMFQGLNYLHDQNQSVLSFVTIQTFFIHQNQIEKLIQKIQVKKQENKIVLVQNIFINQQLINLQNFNLPQKSKRTPSTILNYFQIYDQKELPLGLFAKQCIPFYKLNQIQNDFKILDYQENFNEDFKYFPLCYIQTDKLLIPQLVLVDQNSQLNQDNQSISIYQKIPNKQNILQLIKITFDIVKNEQLLEEAQHKIETQKYINSKKIENEEFCSQWKTDIQNNKKCQKVKKNLKNPQKLKCQKMQNLIEQGILSTNDIKTKIYTKCQKFNTNFIIKLS